MLIGLLLAGQHTSSTTSAWMGFFLARDRALQERCYAEQRAACGEDLPPLDFDQVRLILQCGYIGQNYNNIQNDQYFQNGI